MRRLLLALAVAALVSGWQSAALAEQGVVTVTTVSGPITPVIGEHLRDAVAAAAGDEALIVVLDTPGGLVTTMRDIVQTFLESEVPVVVYVSPRGADAGSAGTFITLAAHVAAMAPATTIGAATPVDLEGGEVGDKVVNNAAAYAEAIAIERGRNVEFAIESVRDGRSIPAGEALEIGAVDLIADDLDDLLARLDGRTIELANGETATLDLADADLVEFDMSGTRRLLQRLADPNLAFIFLSIGTLAIVYEVANPGMGAGGILGAIMLILAMFSLSVLPVNFAGIALIVLALALFTGELFVPGVGVLAAGGTVSLILGGLFMFQRPTGIGVDWWVLGPTALVVSGLAALVAVMVGKTRGTPSATGAAAFVGRHVKVRDANGRGVIDGTWWRLRPEDPGHELVVGREVEVVDSDGLELIVRPKQ